MSNYRFSPVSSDVVLIAAAARYLWPANRVLICPALFQDGCHRADENLHIQREAPALDIRNIQAQPIVEFRTAAGRNLPQAGEAGGDIQSFGVPQAIGPWTERGRAR